MGPTICSKSVLISAGRDALATARHIWPSIEVALRARLTSFGGLVTRLDIEIDGKHRATNFDVLESFRSYVKNAKVIINSNVTPEEGEELVASGKVDAISIGFNYITHPDLVERVEAGKPLDNQADWAHMQTNKNSGDWATGYTDYPRAISS